MKTSIIILTYNQLEYTKQCISSIRKYTNKSMYELIIIDNASNDGTVEWLKTQQDMKVIYNHENLGFPKGCNQGIEIASGDNILLLNNDTVVTHNWLNNLIQCLYSDEKIGAVGPVTNSLAYYSTIPVDYSSMDQMQSFAKEYNISDPTMWEERLKLVGYCLLIKSEVIEQVGLLDEIFTPGNYEDDDYSLRMRRNGYKLILCKDTFIHHYGSVSWKNEFDGFTSLLSENHQKFIDKWGIDPSSFVIHKDLIELIEFPYEQELSILHIGCESGGTLLQLKQKFKASKLYGIEKNILQYKEANKFAKVVNLDFEHDDIPFDEGLFDIIIFSDIDKSLSIENSLRKIKKYLKQDGILIGHVDNFHHFNNIKYLLFGGSPNNLDKRSLTLSDINNLFNNVGLTPEVMGLKNYISLEDEKFINELIKLTHKDLLSQFEASKFLIKAVSSDNDIEKLLENIINSNSKKHLDELQQYSAEEVVDIILSNLNNNAVHLNILAMEHYKNNYHENVIPYLQAAFDLDQSNVDTLYNLAYTLNKYGERDMAIRFLEMANEKDQDIIDLENEIKNQDVKKAEVKFLLRRIEFGIEKKESEKQFVEVLLTGQLSTEDIIDIIEKDVINKKVVLNLLATLCYENKLYDDVIPYLNYAYDLDNEYIDTLFNLGYILSMFGEKKLALYYLEQISIKDKEVSELIAELKGELYEKN